MYLIKYKLYWLKANAKNFIFWGRSHVLEF